MKEITLVLPELGMIAWTRIMLGAGAALLLGERLDREQRKAVGWTLFAVGAASTIPIAMLLFGSRRRGASAAQG
ncbi:MAG TPA: hypothetical protein VK150_09880 [Geothrix sp.]|nr:hypothetical protein [Geothrix sp.]